jgi:hypothetical protein
MPAKTTRATATRGRGISVRIEFPRRPAAIDDGRHRAVPLPVREEILYRLTVLLVHGILVADRDRFRGAGAVSGPYPATEGRPIVA